MVSSRLCLLVAAFSSLIACQIQGGTETCYFPDGSIDTQSIPCSNDINGFGNCCPKGSACMSSTPFCLWLGDWQMDRWSFTNSSVLRDSAPCFFGTLIPWSGVGFESLLFYSCELFCYEVLTIVFFHDLEPGNAHADMTPCVPNTDGSIKYCCGEALGCCDNSTQQGAWVLENTDLGALSIVGSTTAAAQNATATVVSHSCPA
jgi:hypothetical protein